MPRTYGGLYGGEGNDNMLAWLRTQGQGAVNRASLRGIHGHELAPVRGTAASNRGAIW